MKKNGLHTTYHGTGTVAIEEPYVNGRLHGIRKRYYPTGPLEYDEPYENGKLHGTVRHYWEDGAIRGEQSYVHGVEHGLQRHWYENGVVSHEAMMENGKAVGMVRAWHKNGHLASEYGSESTPGTVRYSRTWHENGVMAEELPFINDRLNGIARKWHPNGILAEERSFEMGMMHGVVRNWDSQGNLHGTYEMCNGTGVKKIWREDGTLYTEVSLLNGAMTGRMTSYRLDGSVSGATYFIKFRSVSKSKYMEACEKDPALPRYDDLKPAKTAKQPPLPTPSTQAPGTAEPDPLITRLLNDPKSKEALSWLKRKKGRTLGELETNEESRELAQEIYDLGVVKLTAAEIEDYGAEGTSSKLILELPDDPEKRAAIFEWHAERSEMLGFDPEPDMGQRYLFTMLD